MNFRVIVKSCWLDKERGYHDVIRQTWGSQLGCTTFAMGEQPQVSQGGTLNWDEITLEGVNDDYDHLPEKTKEICKLFATLGGSEHIFLCDCDTFLIPERLAQIKLDADYIGRFTPGPCEIGAQFRYMDARGNHIPCCHPWASGGVGYFLSRKAASIIAKSEITSWAEDLWVGQVLGPRITEDISIKQPPDFECWASWHWHRSREFNSKHYEPRWMYGMWDKYKAGKL